MRKGTGIAGATLLFDARDGEPDLVLAMQYLLDDLRAEGRRIVGLKLTSSTLRLRAEPYEMVVTVAPDPLPASAMHGLLRPAIGDAPDFARVHLGRALRTHSRAMGFLLRRRGAPLADLDEGERLLVHEGRHCLLSVLEAATPSLLIWQPGGLVLSLDEFRRADAAVLIAQGDLSAPLTAPSPDRLSLPRPGTEREPSAEQPPPEAALLTRADRHDKRSLGRLFGKPSTRPPVVPQLDRQSERLAVALRQGDGSEPPPKRRFWAGRA